MLFICGPCVIENYKDTYDIAKFLKELSDSFNLTFIFKASYDKANRTSISSFRGPGISEGLRMLGKIRDELGISVMSDVHRVSEVALAAKVLDILQIPAFLCRQTDLILELAKTGKTINIKKGQFLAPWDVANIVRKILSVRNSKILITERGVMFGYNNLVVDFRSISIMKKMGYPVIFDATHSIQKPGLLGNISGGEREFAPLLARAAVAYGVDGIFMEVHKNPKEALCDGPNSMDINQVEELLKKLEGIKKIVE